MINRVLHVLYTIVRIGTQIVVALGDNRLDVLGGLAFCRCWLEASSQRFNGLCRAEARQTGLDEETYQCADLLAVRSNGQVAFGAQLNEPLKGW